MTMHSNIPHHESGITTSFKGASARIDEIFDELLRNEEVDVMSKVEAYCKLINELCPYVEPEFEKEARGSIQIIRIEAIKLMNGQPNSYMPYSEDFESIIRHKIKDLKDKGSIV